LLLWPIPNPSSHWNHVGCLWLVQSDPAKIQSKIKCVTIKAGGNINIYCFVLFIVGDINTSTSKSSPSPSPSPSSSSSSSCPWSCPYPPHHLIRISRRGRPGPTLLQVHQGHGLDQVDLQPTASEYNCQGAAVGLPGHCSGLGRHWKFMACGGKKPWYLFLTVFASLWYELNKWIIIIYIIIYIYCNITCVTSVYIYIYTYIVFSIY